MITQLKTNKSTFALLLCCLVAFLPARASHFVGGEMTYTWLGTSGGLNQYKVTLIIYEDCMTGAPDVIAQDNPAFFGVYTGASPYTLVRTDSASFTSSVLLPELVNSPCGVINTAGCTMKKTFVLSLSLPVNTTGYTVAYQRCCRNGNVVNTINPTDMGITIFCTIPPASIPNNSAVFTTQITQNAGINQPFAISFSATDADADSLTYELCPAVNGGSASNVKPYPPDPPPYDNAVYHSPYSFNNPVMGTTPVVMNPASGILTGTATQAGLYVIAAACHEWRGGVMINTVRREMELKVGTFNATPFKPYAGNDAITVLVGSTYQFHASGASVYTWSPGTYLDNPNIADPIGTFPDVGDFTYTLHGTTDSGCSGDDVIHVTVLGASTYMVPNAFTPNGDGFNDVIAPIPFGNSTLTDFSIYNRLGNRVFHADNIQNALWDGTCKGKKQDMNVFAWQLKFVDNTGSSRLLKGNFTLIR